MGEYEPKDSRNVTLNPRGAPGEPPRTGPREGETRGGTRQQEGQQTELDEDGRGERADEAIAQVDAEQRERAIERDADELDAARDREGPERFDRND